MTIPEGCMKQIHEALSRGCSGQVPLPSKKWKAFLKWDESKHTYYILLYHYQHLVLVYDVWNKQEIYSWYEKPADKRGLDSARIWLEAYRERIS